MKRIVRWGMRAFSERAFIRVTIDDRSAFSDLYRPALQLPMRFVYSLSMVITVNIPDELAAQARARGLSLEAYVQGILAQQLAAYPSAARQPPTPEEIRTWLDSLAQFSDNRRLLPATIA